jgi:tetratricopeptide (TPR) repeat protein
LGETQTKQARYETALSNLKRGLQILQAQGARGLEASAYKYLGMLHQAMDDPQTAAECFERAIAIADELGIPLAEVCRELRSKLSEQFR